MATQRTANARLQYWQKMDADWHVQFANNCIALDGMQAVGGLCPTPHDVDATFAPTGLHADVAAGSYVKPDGTVGAFGGGTSLCAASATTLVWLTGAGVLTTGTAWPAGAHVRVASVTCDATKITSLVDMRVPFAVTGSGVYLGVAGGTVDDSAGVAVYHTGTANGSKLGGAVGEKLGFWGAAPVAQPSGAAEAFAGAQTQGSLTDSSGGTASTTLAAVADAPTADAVASLAARLAEVKNDVAAVRTLANQLRADLVAVGIIKGSA